MVWAMVQINDQRIVVRQSPSSRIHDDSARRSLSRRSDGCELENRIEMKLSKQIWCTYQRLLSSSAAALNLTSTAFLNTTYILWIDEFNHWILKQQLYYIFLKLLPKKVHTSQTKNNTQHTSQCIQKGKRTPLAFCSMNFSIRPSLHFRRFDSEAWSTIVTNSDRAWLPFCHSRKSRHGQWVTAPAGSDSFRTGWTEKQDDSQIDEKNKNYLRKK